MRPLRNRNPEHYRLITIRTTEARLFIGLSSNVRKIIGGIIARYQEILGIELYAYSVVSNHMHLVAQAPLGNMDEFCENVNREVSRRMNWRLRREGKFWGRRYDDQQILTEEDLLEAFLYVNTNPTKHGLVADSRTWPGLISYEHALDQKDRKFSFNHYAEDKVTHHKLKLSVLPMFKGLKPKARAKKLKELLEERTQTLCQERGKSFLGLEVLLNQTLGDKPMTVSKSPRPRCYTKDPEYRREYREKHRERRRAYAEASMRYRLGLEAEFPEHSFKPPIIRAPRILPFKPITAEYFKNAA